MLGLQILDLVLGLAFIYLLFALITTAVWELIAGWLDVRAGNLRVGIGNLLGVKESYYWLPWRNRRKASSANRTEQPTVVDEFYAHSLIKALGEDGTHPSYIPASTFATVVIDLFDPAIGDRQKGVSTFKAGLDEKIPEKCDLKQTLYILIDQSKGDMEKLKSGIEIWFNNGMERVSAWYKRKTQLPLLGLSLAICFSMNIDTVEIARDLYTHPAKRAALVQEAEKSAPKLEAAVKKIDEISKNPNIKPESVEEIKKDLGEYAEILGDVKRSDLKIGWDIGDLPKDFKNISLLGAALKLLGIVITAIGVSLGAPFWFDLLNRFMAFRSVGKGIEKS